MEVIGFDHVVLVVADVERSLAWYGTVLGLPGVRVEEWRRRQAPFPSVRVDPTTIIDLVPGDTGAGRGNMDHFCVVVAPTDLAAWAASAGVEIEDGPGTRYGAQGDATSIYIRDPDANLVELRCYPPG